MFFSFDSRFSTVLKCTRLKKLNPFSISFHFLCLVGFSYLSLPTEVRSEFFFDARTLHFSQKICDISRAAKNLFVTSSVVLGCSWKFVGQDKSKSVRKILDSLHGLAGKHGKRLGGRPAETPV